jgi:hypothetical protein
MSVKSFRIDELLSDKIGKEANFSNIANKAIEEYLNKSVWIPNYNIEKYAGISAKKLHERIEQVEYLRYREGALTFTLYPGSEKEIEANKNLHAYANGNYNLVHDGYVYFNIKFPWRLFLFLKSKTWEDVERLVHGFLSVLFWSDPSKRNLMEDQIDRKTMKTVVGIVKSEHFKEVELAHKEFLKNNNPISKAKYNEALFHLLIKLGVDPLMFPYVKQILGDIHYPFSLDEIIPSEGGGFDIKLPAGYMRDIYDETDDWQSMVVKGTRKENLQRSESDEESFRNWLMAYEFFHHKELKGKVHVNEKGFH